MMEETLKQIETILKELPIKERVACLADLYNFQDFDKEAVRASLGIDEDELQERLGQKYVECLEDSFYDLPIDFVAKKAEELRKEMEG